MSKDNTKTPAGDETIVRQNIVLEVVWQTRAIVRSHDQEELEKLKSFFKSENK